VEEGALVTTVIPGGPAAAAGLRAGDIITAVEGQAVGAEEPLLNALMGFTPGEEVRVVLNRAGQIIELEVRLGPSS
jgi:S1-C subfamily serine protease